MHIFSRVFAVICRGANQVYLGAQNDGHDDAIDGHCFAEYDTDQILGGNAGSFDGCSKETGSSNEYAPR